MVNIHIEHIYLPYLLVATFAYLLKYDKIEISKII